MGDIIRKYRQATGETQDELGQRYGVSGPAIFKFEKGYVRPSLRLWMRISVDVDLPPRSAVRIWLKDSLPERYKEHVELQGIYDSPKLKSKSSQSLPSTDYSLLKTRRKILHAASMDKAFPKALLEVIQDDSLWALYKPTGLELNRLVEIFSPLGSGSRELYREALHCLRMFGPS